jgi:tripartite-type tricarboxylate transporter receptor subunit TctC
MRTRMCKAMLLAEILVVGVPGAGLTQDGVAQFYKGKTINIIVGTSAGGGYDLYARMLSRHMGKHIPGSPTFVVNNMPGAASNIAASHIYNVAAKDGTVMGAIFMGAVVEPLFSNKTRPTHDTSKFNYIGNANKDFYICLIRAEAPVKDYAEAFEKELVMGGTAEGASTRDFAVLQKNVLGTKFKIVSGYPGSREVNLATERGEVHGGCGQSWSSVSANHRTQFNEGRFKVLVQEDSTGYPELNKLGIPKTRDFAKTDEQRQILDLIYSQTEFGRPFVVAPEVPKERVDALRRAFMAAMKDPELVAEAKKIELDIDAVGGEELQARIVQMYATPKDILDKAKQALTLK